MKPVDCLFERVSNVGVGIALLFIAMAFSLIGTIIAPLLSLLAAIPAFVVGFYFIGAPKSRECRIN